MKKLTFSFLLLALGTLFCAFSPKIKHSIQTESLRALLNQVALNWNKMHAQTDLTYKAIDSYIPEYGVRGRYAVVKQTMGKKVIETLVGKKVFLGGPHMDEMDFAHSNFGQRFSHSYAGRYNPVFLTELHKLLKATLDQKDFVFDFQSFYNAQLKRYLRTYYLSFQAKLDQSIRGAYDAQVSSDSLNFYEAQTCGAFWDRRTNDGTDDEFYDLLILMLKTFDPEYLEIYPEIQQPKAPALSSKGQDRIQEIRTIYQDYNAHVKTMAPAYEETEQSDEGNGWESTSSVYTDHNGKTVVIITEYSDGYSSEEEYYFQDDNIAFIYTNEVRPFSHVTPDYTANQSRLYFDEYGKVIRALTKSAKGQFGGYEPNMDEIPNQEVNLSIEKANYQHAAQRALGLISRMRESTNR